MIKEQTRYYTVSLPCEIGMEVEKEAQAADLNVLAYLATVLAWLYGKETNCLHPPRLVPFDSVPQCLGCGEFL